MEWRFGETLIAKIKSVNNIFSTYDGDYGEFKDKLKLIPQTGDLIISDIREEHNGVYKLKIIRDGETLYKRFRLFIICETKILEVYEGESVNLKTEVTDIQKDDVIEWRFGETLIAKINPANNILSTNDGDDDLFKDKLKLNPQTGDLTIGDSKREYGGVYKLKIIRGGKTSCRKFDVSVRRETKTLEVDEGKSADLKTEVNDIKTDDVMEWRFGKTLIAKINPANNIFSTYDGDDDLFRDKLKLNHHTGDLNINDIRQKHTGVYTLKIIRDGETSYKTISVSVKCDVETLRVDEWNSVDLMTKVKDIQRVEKIEWRFKESLIAQINPANNIFRTYDGDDDLFKDKLKLNPQTGDLNINYIRWEHTGDYLLKIIRGEGISYRRFRVHVRDKMEPLSVDEGEYFNLETKLKDMQGYDVIEWRFEGTLIAKINPANKLYNTYDDDALFRDKLTLNHQTGDLTINDIRHKHSGVYKLRRITYGVPPYPYTFFVLVRDNMEPVSVDEGKSVDLKTEVNDIQRDDVIEWRFGETLIAKINPVNNIFSTYDGDDGEFRDKLDLDHQTGDLNIKNIRREHNGVYKLKITRGGKTSYKRFNVSVRAGGDSEEKRGKDSEKREKDSEKRGKDSEKRGKDSEKRGKDSEKRGKDSEKRGEDSVRIEMQPLLNKRSQQQ